MAEVINLRTARKRAQRREKADQAAANRLLHGRSKQQRKLAAARHEKAEQDLERHRLDR
jgi:hypothetical protein